MQDDERTTSRYVGLPWILVPPTVTSSATAALLTFTDPYLSGHTPSGPVVAIGQRERWSPLHQWQQPPVGCARCVLLRAFHCAKYAFTVCVQTRICPCTPIFVRHIPIHVCWWLSASLSPGPDLPGGQPQRRPIWGGSNSSKVRFISMDKIVRSEQKTVEKYIKSTIAVKSLLSSVFQV